MSGPRLDIEKVAAARLRATVRFPYLASALFACAVQSTPDSGTISVDEHWRLQVDPLVASKLSVDELARLFVHLTGHLLREHANRATALAATDENGGWWNRAADAELNDDLALDDFVPATAGDLPADLNTTAGALAETYYQAQPILPRRWDCGSGVDAQPRNWNQDGPPRLEPGAAELVRLGVAADIQNQERADPGSVPGGWRRWAKTVLPSRIDWRRILASEIRRALAAVSGSVDYTYRRPSRRAQSAPGVVLPSLIRPVPDVAIVVDTSGSMHEELLAIALAEIEALLAKAGLRTAKARVLAVDTTVQAVSRVSRASQVQLAGGGGTDMAEGIAAATALRPRPSIIIVLTDGITPWPPAAPQSTRVIVGLIGSEHASRQPPAWARVVPITADGS